MSWHSYILRRRLAESPSKTRSLNWIHVSDPPRKRVLMRLTSMTTVGMVLVVLAGFPTPAALADDPPTLEKEIAFGVKMAQRGLWNEALFRFKRAAEFRPDDAKVLNNLAVAYEAVGQYDNALLAYQEALRADSGNQESAM